MIYDIKGCIFTVYNTLGSVWAEEVYEQALELELKAKGFTVDRQRSFDVFYFNKRVGHYRLDLLVENTVILELKAAPEVYPLQQAQLISYLKGFDKPIGILANFGCAPLYHQIMPNKLNQPTPLLDTFDFDKVTVKGKEKIEGLLYMANRILITLGPGYFHQVYRRSFYEELKSTGIRFDVVKEIKAVYRQQEIGSKDAYFFILDDLLLSTVAIKELNKQVQTKFCQHMRYLKCKRGLIFNFNALHLTFNYFE